MTDWAIPQQAKLKYTQLFNLHDRNRGGFLSGLQCRDILLQSGLPRNTLAEIWNLSDIDGDGQLTREEFILAMHLTNQVRSGQMLPPTLPDDLVPPSYRRTRSISTASVHSAVSGSSNISGNNDDTLVQKISVEPTGSAGSSFAAGSILNSHSFENKRKENFEKGRAELERRRLQVIEQQSAIVKEQLAVCKKQVAEAKAKIDAMRTDRDSKMGLITFLEAQLTTVRDKKAYLQHEEQNIIAIAKDLNLVNSNQAKLDELATQTKQQNINQMKEKLRELEKENCEKVKLLDEVTKNVKQSEEELKVLTETAKKTYETYTDKIANAKILREQFINENKTKTVDLDSVWDSTPAFEPFQSNSRPESTILNSSDDPWGTSDPTGQTSFTNQFDSSIINNNNIDEKLNPFPGQVNPTKAMNFGVDQEPFIPSAIPTSEPIAKVKKFRALYAFEARNHDELTINPGDIIIGSEAVCEPGWLSGEVNGQVGLFPEAYVELLEDDSLDLVHGNTITNTNIADGAFDFLTKETGLSEIAPNNHDQPNVSSKYKALYAFEARNTDELTINPGDVIVGVDGLCEPGWLMGELNGQQGLFPEGYVEKIPDLVAVESQPQAPEAGKLQRMSSVGSLRSKKSRSKKAEVATVIANYRALGQEQLNLEKGQLVLIRRKMESGWWEGEVQVKDKARGDRPKSELEHLIGELITSELDYLNDLRLCQETYISPLSQASYDITQFFLNWHKLIELHEMYLSKMQEKISKTNDLRDDGLVIYIFDSFGALISSSVNLYVDFCMFQDENTRRLEAKIASDLRFKQLVNECERKVKNLLEQQAIDSSDNNLRIQRNYRLPLTSLMLKPMQRITKYSLLFERIAKALNDNEDLSNRARQLQLSAQKLCLSVNDACKVRQDHQDNKYKLKWVQSHIIQAIATEDEQDPSRALLSIDISRLAPSPTQNSSITMRDQREFITFDSTTSCMGARKLLKTGSLFKLTSGKEVIFFLFNDTLLMTQPKVASPLRVMDIFRSERAKQSYYKPYKTPILLEDLMVLQNVDAEDVNAPKLDCSWSSGQDVSLLVSFKDQSSGRVYNFQSLNVVERDIWNQELHERSLEAMKARQVQQMRLFPRPNRRLSVKMSYARLFITVLELKIPRNLNAQQNHLRRTNSSIGDMNHTFDGSSSNFYGLSASLLVQLKRLKHNNITNHEQNKREIVPISEPFKTTPVNLRSSNLYSYRTTVVISKLLYTIQYNEACMQFLLEENNSDEFTDYLEISLMDEPKFRESKVILRRRVNLNQMLGLEDRYNESNTTSLVSDNSSFQRKTSVRLEPNRPVEYVFKFRSGSRRPISMAVDALDRQLGSTESNERDANNYEKVEPTVKLRFHLQIFANSDNQ